MANEIKAFFPWVTLSIWFSLPSSFIFRFAFSFLFFFSSFSFFPCPPGFFAFFLYFLFFFSLSDSFIRYLIIIFFFFDFVDFLILSFFFLFSFFAFYLSFFLLFISFFVFSLLSSLRSPMLLLFPVFFRTFYFFLLSFSLPLSFSYFQLNTYNLTKTDFVQRKTTNCYLALLKARLVRCEAIIVLISTRSAVGIIIVPEGRCPCRVAKMGVIYISGNHTMSISLWSNVFTYIKVLVCKDFLLL